MKKISLNLSKNEEDRAIELHQKSIVFDGSVSGQRIVNAYPGYLTNDVCLMELLKKGGLSGANMTMGLFNQIDDYKKLSEQMIKWYGVLERYKELVLPAIVAEDIVKAKNEGKVALLAQMQNATFLDLDLSRLELFQRLGLRVIQPTYNNDNFLGGGCTDRTNCGLSNLGLKFVEEMNRLNLVIDVSHSGVQTTLDAIEFSKDPIIFSHCNVRALNSHPYGLCRNKSDEEIQALAEKGGVIGITVFSTMLEAEKGVRPTINEWLNHVDCVVDLVGVDHVGIGTDWGQPALQEEFDQQNSAYGMHNGYALSERHAKDLEYPDSCLTFTRGLVARGYSDNDIIKILGENWIRVYRTIIGK